MAIKAIIFDCFGVLALSGQRHLEDQYPPEIRQQIVDLGHASDRGFITKDEYSEHLAAITGMSLAQAESTFWLGDIRNEKLFELIRKIKNENIYKVGLLSNIGPGWMDKFIPERAELFDAVVLSGEVGVAKPDLEIYQMVARNLGVEPSECVMIDDQPGYCEGAQMAGMQSILFANNEQSMSDLASLLESSHA